MTEALSHNISIHLIIGSSFFTFSLTMLMFADVCGVHTRDMILFPSDKH